MLANPYSYDEPSLTVGLLPRLRRTAFSASLW